MRIHAKFYLFFVLMFGGALASLAQAEGEGALYGPEAPAGSAFIRVFNGQINLPVKEASVAGKELGEVDPISASKYVFLEPGSMEVDLDGKKHPVTLDKDSYYTLILMDGGVVKLVKDEAFDNRRKALVSFYNLTDVDSLDLKTSNGKTAILESVSQLDTKNRQVNAVKISVAAFSGDQKLADAAPVNLERGKVFSLFACGDKSSPKLVWVESQVSSQI